jgi:hypothetical protein
MTERKGRGPQKLTIAQQEALDMAREADNTWRDAKKVIHKRIAQQVETELAKYSALRDQAIYHAVEVGVPKSRVGIEGLGTSSPNAVYEALARVEAELELSMPEVAKRKVNRFSWTETGLYQQFRYAFLVDSEAFITPEFSYEPFPEGTGWFRSVGVRRSSPARRCPRVGRREPPAGGLMNNFWWPMVDPPLPQTEDGLFLEWPTFERVTPEDLEFPESEVEVINDIILGMAQIDRGEAVVVA